MKKSINRLLSLLLVVALLCGITLPVYAHDAGLSWSKVDNGNVSNPLRPSQTETEEQAPLYAATDIVRVAIVLEKPSALEAGFPAKSVAENAEAMAYRRALEEEQKTVAARIGAALGEKLDVVSGLTLIENMISANVAYGKLDEIRKVEGVKSVSVETRFEPLSATKSGADKPNMVISASMTGASIVWEAGYTGAGTRVAIIDTGLDTDHQSFDPDALKHALEEDARLADMTYEDYLKKINVLTVDELREKLPELHVSEMYEGLTAEQLYINLKSPFAFNYIDRNLDVTHDNDAQGEHGSHVAGIAAANRYIKDGAAFVSAAETVQMVGNAPDCQIITMKVFGTDGGAYASDYMLAIEDAIVLGCDSVNLSLGSANPGYTYTSTPEYAAVMERITESDMIVAMASGNDGYWASDASGLQPYLYIEDINFQTAGSPGTYTNSLSVASVNNDGTVGASLCVGDLRFGYSDGDGGYNDPMSSLDVSGKGTEYEYVFLETYGEEDDFDGIDVEGKIVFVSRGAINFADKAYNARSNGAVATVVYNNELAMLAMNLSGYYYSEPCVFISMARGRAVKELSQKQTAENGTVYYTGKITVSSALTANVEGSEFYTMSAFTSWGIPGDLSMKPEITAPGGNIWSVNGATEETDQYEMMSGTSMATPQISGIAALLMQHIRETERSQTGLTDRALAQSLMMSTAKALKDDQNLYYSILQQGSGLVDIAAAVGAESYILVDGQPDGKVKAELGDDPERTGTYTFTFTLNNFTNAAHTYALSAEMFTQGYFYDYASEESNTKVAYLDTLTKYLDFNVKFESSDAELLGASESLDGCDFNGDGKVDANDAQALLDYVVGKTETLYAKDKADLSGDGTIGTYDVHLFLARMNGTTVTLPASGKATVTVTLTLTDEQKEELDEIYVNGAYVQAFVYAKGVADDEGVAGTEHSIPVLGFYGNWTDPSMYEIGNAQTLANGEEIRTPYTGSTNNNTLMGEYSFAPGETYTFGGNPLIPDSVYMPERNAYNNVVGNRLSSLIFNPIRNAIDARLRVTNETTGKLLFEEYGGAVGGAYNGVFFIFEVWYNATQEFEFSNWNPRGLSEGETFRVDLELAPEYYLNEDDTVRWDELGKGAKISIPMTIDNTAPVIEDISVSDDGKTLTVRASDNQYVAAVAMFNSNGKQVISSVGSKAEAKPGESYEYTLDISEANGRKFLIQVYDYAYNISTYELKMELGTVESLPDMIAFDCQYREYGTGYWTSFSTSSGRYDLSVYADSDVLVNAATIYNGFVFASTLDGELYVMPQEDLLDVTRVCDMGVVLDDMAYNPADDTIYGIGKDSEGESVLYSIDALSGALTKIGTIGLKTNTLACDEKGTFYCNELGTGKVYSFTLKTMSEPSFLTECTILRLDYSTWEEVESPLESMGNQAMEINPNTGKLVWTSYTYEVDSYGWTTSYAFLFEIDTAEKTFKRYEDFGHQLTGLIIPGEEADTSWADPTDTVTSLSLATDHITLLQGNSASVTATVLPWTVSDRSVTWKSEDESVATVNANGVITAVSKGETTVTATSKLDPSFTASVKVTVETLPVTLEGILAENSTHSRLFRWNAEYTDWSEVLRLDVDNVLSATADGKGSAYVTSSGYTMYKTDLTTGESKLVATREFGIYDLAYSPVFSTEEQDKLHIVVGSIFLPAKDPADADDDLGFDLFNYIYDATGGTELIAIASAGAATYVDEDGNNYDTELVYIVDDKGGILRLYTFFDENAKDYSAWLEIYQSDLLEEGFALTTNNEHLNLCSLVVGEDGNLYFANYTGRSSNIFRLTYNEETEQYDALRFLNSGEDYWPVSLLKVSGNSESGEAITGTASAKRISAEKVSTSNVKSHEKATAKPTATEKETFTVTLKAKDLKGNLADATNALFNVRFDATKLKLESVETNANLAAYYAADGEVTFGFASASALPAETVLATLTFRAVAAGCEAEVEIMQTEWNESATALRETLTFELPGCKHEHTELVGKKDATCTREGYTGDLVCSDCGEVLEKGHATDVLDHEMKDEVVAPTCETTGYTIHTCEHCGYSYIDSFVPALGHDFKQTVTKEPTCTEEGEWTFTCTHEGCDESYTMPIPKLEHEMTTTVVDPTCEGYGYTVHKCEHCDFSYISDLTQPTGHIHTETVGKKDADCKHEGYTGDTVCSDCGKVLEKGSVIPAHCPSSDYKDVSRDAWYHDAVDFMVENGIMQGYEDGTFRPNRQMTRAEFVQMLYNMFDEEDRPDVSDLENPFKDVKDGFWAHDAIVWAASEGYVNGMSADTFGPNETITREQIITIIYRIVDEGSVEEDCLSDFADANAISGYAKDAMNWAVSEGILEGDGGKLRPRDKVTRAEVATIIMRID